MNQLKQIALSITIASHFILCVAFLACFIILPIKTPWYIALPLVSSIYQLMTTRVTCPLTTLENKILRSLGKPEISGFISYHIYRRNHGN